MFCRSASSFSPVVPCRAPRRVLVRNDDKACGCVERHLRFDSRTEEEEEASEMMMMIIMI